jgi:hypothetical protein
MLGFESLGSHAGHDWVSPGMVFADRDPPMRRASINRVAHPLMFRIAISCIPVESNWYHPN